MPLNNPGGGSVLTVHETSVFNGAAPAIWTDLDISAVVGNRVVLALLKAVNNDGVNNLTLKARTNGDVDLFYAGISTWDNYSLGPGRAGLFAVITDVNGIFEWGSGIGATTEIFVEGFTVP